MPIVEVVSAVILNADYDHVLLTQRRQDKDYPFTWECPGEKVDGMEGHAAALRRELREELGLELAPEHPTGVPWRLVWSGEYEGKFALNFYAWPLLVRYLPQPREDQGVGWFTADEMFRASLTPGNRLACESLVYYMREVSRR